MLRFKVDENLPEEAAALLRAQGHDALTVHDQRLTGAADINLSGVCKREGRVIVTLDVDFANIRVYPPTEHPGIIVLRLDHQDKESVLSSIAGMLPAGDGVGGGEASAARARGTVSQRRLRPREARAT